MNPFFGRRRELEMLNRLLKKNTASLVVIKGRRRIGKSRLAEEFGKTLKTFTFVGLPPEKNVTAKMQRQNFANQMQRVLNIPGLQQINDWNDLFWHLANHTKKGRILIVMDEINWMGSKDPTFLGKLKTAWDQYFRLNPQLIMILSGSMSVWIEENILSSTGFVGRISLDITLQELPLYQCNHFWGKRENLISSYDKFKVLSVTGGVPRYLEEIDANIPADENIRRLCFEKEGLLFEEFEKIFTDLFSKRGDAYRTILQRLAAEHAAFDQICETLGLPKGGTVTQYLKDLVVTGFVARDATWNLKEGTVSKLCRYRLKDNYLRFYLKYIEPNKSKIEKGVYNRPPAYEAMLGLQFENLVLNNSKQLWKKLNLSPEDILFENPFFQRKTALQPGCQIDFMIQTKYNVLYVCEIKFSRELIDPHVIEEVKKKIQSLKTPKNFSIIPVLIHVNGVTKAVVEADFFSRIIDFSELLVED